MRQSAQTPGACLCLGCFLHLSLRLGRDITSFDFHRLAIFESLNIVKLCGCACEYIDVHVGGFHDSSCGFLWLFLKIAFLTGCEGRFERLKGRTK